MDLLLPLRKAAPDQLPGDVDLLQVNVPAADAPQPGIAHFLLHRMVAE